MKNIKYYFFTLLTSMLLVNCSVVEKPFAYKGNEIEYAESLFKRQNQVTQQVMILLEDELSWVDEERVSDAELKMHDACHLLNDIANRERNGEKMSFNYQRQAHNSFTDCDNAVKEMETILKAID